MSIPRRRSWLGSVLLLVVFIAIAGYAVSQHNHYKFQGAFLVHDTTSAYVPSVKQYRGTIATTLQSNIPILQVEKPSVEQAKALHILAASSQLPALAYDKDGGPYRLEVLQSYKLPPGQATGQLATCAYQTCYRLDIFNFTLNTAVVAITNLTTSRLLAAQPSSTQPDLSPRLNTIAVDIANNNDRVKQTMGDHDAPIMSSTKTSLQRTVCETSHHLCVAPTYVLKDKKSALWVIVDLTDLKVVGTAWTKWDDKPEPVTERQLTTEAIEQSLCGQVTHAHRGDWAFDYTLTGSDGLEIRNVTYKGQSVVTSAKNVDWHVSYSSQDDFGYSDAIGCPEFSTAAVVPSGLPQVSESNGNVMLGIDFISEKWPEPCNYHYRQQFQMNKDGSLRVVVANVGRGCGDDGTYRPVTRIELPAPAHAFQKDGQPQTKETWWQPGDCIIGTSCPALSYKTDNQSYDVIPGNGQFGDGGRADNPFMYLTSADNHRMEGQQDLLTIGSCCRADYRQGPDAFVNNEALAGRSVALWYVAQLKNDGTAGEQYCWADNRIIGGKYTVDEYPCYSGPLLKPQGN